MRVKYPIVKKITVDKDVKYDIEYCTGEIVGYVSGRDDKPDKFVVCDDESGAFIKVNVGECFKVD